MWMWMFSFEDGFWAGGPGWVAGLGLRMRFQPKFRFSVLRFRV